LTLTSSWLLSSSLTMSNNRWKTSMFSTYLDIPWLRNNLTLSIEAINSFLASSLEKQNVIEYLTSAFTCFLIGSLLVIFNHVNE
jgi:hypothetical protein